jgi:hypothetical protein
MGAEIIVIGANEQGNLVFTSGTRGVRITRFQDASLGILTVQAKEVCDLCCECTGIIDIRSNGTVDANCGKGVPEDVLGNGDCPLLNCRFGVDSDHLVTQQN